MMCFTKSHQFHKSETHELRFDKRTQIKTMSIFDTRKKIMHKREKELKE